MAVIDAIDVKPLAVIDDEEKPTTRPSSKSVGTAAFGFAVVIIAFVGIGGWASLAPLASAVTATAILSVKGERKQVQHLEGGIVEKILVEEGETVKAGQLLLLLERTFTGSSVTRLGNQIDQLLAKKARFEAESKWVGSITFPSSLLSRSSENYVSEIIASESRQFRARRNSIEGQINILRQRMDQLGDEINGLRILRKSRLEQLDIYKKEIIGLRALYEKGYYPRARVLAMEREIARLRGEVGGDDASIARAKNALGEAKSQIINLRQRFQEDVVSQHQRTQFDLADLVEQKSVADDALKRVEVKAVQSGIVQNLQVHTIGGVVRAGQVLMEIAPQDQELMVEAQVSPNDIDSIKVGQIAEVRLVSLNKAKTPSVMADVISVSGDRLVDQKRGFAYFLIRAKIPNSEKEALGDIQLSAGMPADVLIKTGENTALAYFLKPITDALARGLNEE
jgi:HlyD family secretion protein/epimerase transport system membrane fusion protein